MLDRLVGLPHPVEIRGLTVGSSGGLERCAPTLPLCFGFDWQGTHFNGSVVRQSDRLVLKLAATFAQAPFTAEDVSRRESLLALASATDKEMSGPLLSISIAGELELNQQISLPPDAALTANLLVTETTTALLSSAALLDLIAESGLIAPGPTAAPAV